MTIEKEIRLGLRDNHCIIKLTGRTLSDYAMTYY